MRRPIEINSSKYEYCPNGNYWEDVSGIFDRKIYLYCDCRGCNGKLYELRPIDVTKKLGEEAVKTAKETLRFRRVQESVTYKNMEEVAKITNPTHTK